MSNYNDFISRTRWAEASSDRELKDALARIGWTLKTGNNANKPFNRPDKVRKTYEVHPQRKRENGATFYSKPEALSFARESFLTQTRENIESRINADTYPTEHKDAVHALLTLIIDTGHDWKNHLFSAWRTGNYRGIDANHASTLQRLRNSQQGRNLINEIPTL